MKFSLRKVDEVEANDKYTNKQIIPGSQHREQETQKQCGH